MTKVHSSSEAVFWFRNDLRLKDNPALQAATKNASITRLIFILDRNKRELGEAAAWWLHHSLEALSKDIQELGSQIHFFQGEALKTLLLLHKETNFEQIFWNRLYEPKSVERDKKLKEELEKLGVKVNSFTDPKAPLGNTFRSLLRFGKP